MPRKTHESAHHDTTALLTPIPFAVAEIQRRSKNAALRRRVEEFLEHDIPSFFKNGPILYLARDTATPNFEVLRFIELAKPYGLPIIIGQDTHTIFSSDNALEYALGVMPIVVKVSDNREIITEDVRVIDLEHAEGKQLKHIKTLFGVDFVKFHNDLLSMIYPNVLEFHNSGSWVDRHHRGDHLEYYKKILALSITHGVLFEFYEPCDKEFASDVFAKAFAYVEHEFGMRPLVCQLEQVHIEKNRTCDAYPSIIYRTVKDKLAGVSS